MICAVNCILYVRIDFDILYTCTGLLHRILVVWKRSRGSLLRQLDIHLLPSSPHHTQIQTFNQYPISISSPHSNTNIQSISNIHLLTTLKYKHSINIQYPSPHHTQIQTFNQYPIQILNINILSKIQTIYLSTNMLG